MRTNSLLHRIVAAPLESATLSLFVESVLVAASEPSAKEKKEQKRLTFNRIVRAVCACCVHERQK